MSSSALSDSVKPIYEFNWPDRTRRTDTLENGHALGASGVELLADCGRDDPDCTVELVGYES